MRFLCSSLDLEQLTVDGFFTDDPALGRAA
jgi:hypothetical protein